MTDNVKFYVFEKAAQRMDEEAIPHTQRRRYRLNLGAVFYYNLHWTSLIYGILGFLMGGATVLSALLPFGIAYYAAIANLDRRLLLFQAWPVLFGYGLATGIMGCWPYAVICLLLTLFFLAYPQTKKKPWFLVPVIVFSVSLVVRGIFLAFSGVTDFLLIAIFFESVFAAGLSLIFSVTLQAWHEFRFVERLRRDEILCTCIFLLALIPGLQPWVFFGLSAAEVAMRFFILFAALLAGPGGGAAAGAITGIIPSLSQTVSPAAIGIYAFSGLLAGAFHLFHRVGVIVGFILGNLILSFYLFNSDLIAQNIIATLIAALLLVVIPKGQIFRLKELLQPAVEIIGKKEIRPNYDNYLVRRLNTMGRTLDHLKQAMAGLSQEKDAREEKNIQAILKHISDRVCLECSLRKMCWENDFYQTYRDVMAMFAAAEANGVITSKDIPKTFKKRCSHSKEMKATINCLFEMYEKGSYWQKQIAGSRYLALSQLENTVMLLTKMTEDVGSFYQFRELMTGSLALAMREQGFAVDRIQIQDVREKNFDLEMRIRHCPGGGRCGPYFHDAINALTGRNYCLAEYICGDPKAGENCRCRLFLEGTWRVLTSSLQLPKADSDVSGDSKGDFLLSEGRQVMMISDGMGSGPQARKEADLTVDLVKDVLECGFDESFAANVVNYLLLMNREEEVYATVDLCLFDLYKGEAEFIKLGASPSYICSKDGVKVISGNSMPLGMMAEANVISFKEEVNIGDIIVMVSDGILDTGLKLEEMEFWISKTLEDSREEEPRIIAERLISGAVSFAGGKPKDDMTIMVALVQ